MIWIIVVCIIGYSFIRFFSALSKDTEELSAETLYEKFEITADLINEYAFDGKGDVKTLSPRQFHIYEDGSNQIIDFQYSTGHLTITWKYKYFQKEVVHKVQFNHVRNVSIFEKKKIAEQMITEMAIIVHRHQQNVLGEI